jgi:predicted nucleotidyltransferase/predicted transcriptional regulator
MEKIHNTTKDKILKVLLSNKKENFTIRSISKKINLDYKTVYLTIQKLAKKEVIETKKIGQSVLCSIKNNFNEDVFRIEFIRVKELLQKKDFYVLHKQIQDDIKKPFFTLLLFGSHASGKQTKHSDIDLMLITNDKDINRKIKHVLSLLPLKIHLLDFTSKELLTMLKTTEFNVGKEAVDNNIILFGIENYYRLINNV